MTYNAFGGTLNLAHSINHAASHKNANWILMKILWGRYIFGQERYC